MFDQPIHVLLNRELDVRQLGRHVDQAVEQLRAGDFRAADARKLKGTGLYRARLDERNRLLFKFGQHEGRRALLILEVVHNHDYARSRFLGGGEVREEDFEPAAGRATAEAWDGLERERLAYLHPTSSVFHLLDKPLSFDDAQSAVFGTPLPLIVIGSAGSGKTALTLEKLKTLPGHGLYLTRSSFLVENARSLYYAHRYANDGQEVDFLSLSELVETIQVPSGREARWPDFAAWFSRHQGTFKLREPHRIFEEVTGVLTGSAEKGPHLSEAEYLALGIRQSIFLGEERRTVYRLFERWLAHLRERGLFDANVAAWERRALAAERYDFLVIDEVQDVTPVELRLALATLKDKSAFLLCGDANRIVHPNLFSWARVKSIFHRPGGREGAASPLDRIHILSANYRNTRAVTALANRLLLIKQRRFGSVDRESNYLVECVSGEEGRVELLTDGPRVRGELEARTRRSARTAVVVLRDEDKAAARAAFSTPLVFAVQEAKGLEYDNVVLFNLVGSAAREYRECAAGVEAAELEGGLDYARARDKSDKSLDAYKFYVNALYVAMTRAVKSLVVVEADPAHPLLALLAVGQAGEAVALAAEESSREEWQREARRLELQGKAEQAERIRRDILEVRPVPWAVANPASLAGLRSRALGPGPVDKAAQQLLFEFAVTYDVPALLPRLVAAGFRHARKAESGRAYIEGTHYAEYRQRRSPRLQDQLRAHGVDFRNPLNETPLMVAARLGRPDLVAELLALGADPEAIDTAGRSALRVALAGFLEQRGVKAAAFQQVWEQLAAVPLKVKLGDRMTKLDPSTGEWFLLQLLLVKSRGLLAQAAAEGLAPVFDAPTLARWVAELPPGVLAPYRRRREYLSSLLVKNELGSSGPCCRRLFQRLRRGAYALCPALELQVEGGWVPLGELLGLPDLIDAIGPAAEGLSRWMTQVRAEYAPPAATEPSPDPDAAGEAPRRLSS
ncbi:MAG: ankyrin repeat domain-containing protein [Anaeromyxobacter sp.]